MNSKKYVVAVSGGVDSVVLLDMLLTNKLKIQSTILKPDDIIVAHFDHGIRRDSNSDRKFVEEIAKEHGLKFYYKREELGPGASEEIARDRRYAFLMNVLEDTGATTIITAHHYDDLIETSIINLIRGTNRLGLSALKNRQNILRPLLRYTKNDLIEYARSKKMLWREDYTNYQDTYLRSRIRKQLTNADQEVVNKLCKELSNVNELNLEIDKIIKLIFDFGNNEMEFDKPYFISLPHSIECEIIAYWLRLNKISFDKKLIQKIVIDIKVLKIGKKIDLNKKCYLVVGAKQIRMIGR